MTKIRGLGGGTLDGPAKRVTRTGLALVHEGELVLPAAGSEAQAVVVAEDARQVVHYHFPIEIVVQGRGAEPVDVEAAIDRRLAALVDELRNLA